jgi:hypothetical protein
MSKRLRSRTSKNLTNETAAKFPPSPGGIFLFDGDRANFNCSRSRSLRDEVAEFSNEIQLVWRATY